MAVPAWATRKWRPLASDLYEHVVTPETGNTDPDKEHVVTQAEAPSASLQRRRSSRDDAVLHVDRLVAGMYSHRFFDVTPQQVQQELREYANKFSIHSLPDRAERLRHLTGSGVMESSATAPLDGNGYLVVKLLLELANAPTRASNAQVARGDRLDTSEAQSIWARVLPRDYNASGDGGPEHDAMVAKMEQELLQVAWEDDWWTEMNARSSDGSDESGSDGDDIDMEVDNAYDVAGGSDITVIAVNALNQVKNDTDKEKVNVAAGPDAGGDSDSHDSDDSDDSDDLLIQYYDQSQPDVQESNEIDTNAASVPDASSTFAIDTPSLLLLALAQEMLPTATAKSMTVLASISSRKVVHEQTVLGAVFHALSGVASPLFDISTATPALEAFNGELRTSTVSVSSLARRELAVAHLSPTTLSNILQSYGAAATNLICLEEIAAFVIVRPSVMQGHSGTAEGFVDALRQQLLYFRDAIERVRQQVEDGANADRVGQSDEDTTLSTLPTLLGVMGKLKELFATINWLRDCVVMCFTSFQTRPKNLISPAELSSEILTTLFDQLKLSFIELSGDANDDPQWSRYDILLRLFSGALLPYLDAMDNMLFAVSHTETIVLHPELFFRAPEESSTTTQSPRSTLRRQNEKFQDAVLAMMPFRVELANVPTFLRPLIRLMSEALLSRQMTNRYIHQKGSAHDNCDDDDSILQRLTVVARSQLSLAELFAAEISKSFTGSKHSPVGDKSTYEIASRKRSIPFNQIVELCVNTHIEQKCVIINSVIASLFREKLQFNEHLDVLHLFVLMHQQDVFAALGLHLIEQMQINPIAWADTESINAVLQREIERIFEEGAITTKQRNIAGHLSIRVNPEELQSFGVSRLVDIRAVRCLYFTFSMPQPLRVLFVASTLRKYSRLACMLLQVKIAESAITKFKLGLRHRVCFGTIEDLLREPLVRIAGMLQYSKCILRYLANQMTGDLWLSLRKNLKSAHSVSELNTVHEKYVDDLLGKFFLLDKQSLVPIQLLENFNHIIQYVSKVDEFVRTTDRNMDEYFGRVQHHSQYLHRQEESKPKFQADFVKLKGALSKTLDNYNHKVFILIKILEAMTKNGAASNVSELHMLLTFNSYRAREDLHAA